MGVDLMPFADNWAYLKTELAWLDRLLMLAVSRQRKETKVVEKVATTAVDRVSSHWWKGVISVPNPAYDDCRVPPAALKPKCKPMGYQHQLERRIKVSAQSEVVLALPSLRNYLNLTLFEKNLILMVLAPEVNRRYGRLYRFLQTGDEKSSASDLPMVDLGLRLLCRNDLERRRARARLSGPGSLIDKRILHYVAPRPSTRLSSYLQLSDEWVDYLLAEAPDQKVLFERLATPTPVLALPAPTAATRAVKITQPTASWDQLILPAPILSQLQGIGQQASASLSARSLSAQELSSQSLSSQVAKGTIALLVGEHGTGKTMAAGAIATSIRQSLSTVDLSQVAPEDWLAVLNSLDASRYPMLLVKSAPIWFGRDRDLSQTHLRQWLHQRQLSPGLTLLSARYVHTVQARWRQQLDATITFPIPHKAARKMLWRQALAGITCSDKIDWMLLAAQLKLPGGLIGAIAQDAIIIAQSKNAKNITFSHIQQALKQRDLSVSA